MERVMKKEHNETMVKIRAAHDQTVKFDEEDANDESMNGGGP